MTLLHDAYTALLSGLTMKTGNEIHWEDQYGNPITVEPIDITEHRYVVRWCYENGNKWWEEEYHQNQRHGKSIEWYKNGNKRWEEEWKNGKQHRKDISWYENGNKSWEEEYKDGKFIK